MKDQHEARKGEKTRMCETREGMKSEEVTI